MSRVIVIQQPVRREADSVERPAFDFSPAKEFGEVEVLAPNGKHILTPDVFRATLEEGLRFFDPEVDFIIPVGDYTVILFVGMLLGERYKRIRVLRWVPSARAYQPITLDVRR